MVTAEQNLTDESHPCDRAGCRDAASVELLSGRLSAFACQTHREHLVELLGGQRRLW